MIVLTIVMVLLACAADAYTTVKMIERGGREKWSEWLVGIHPSQATIWVTFFAFPALAYGLLLYVVPGLHWLGWFVVLVRGYAAWHNHTKVMR